MTATIRHVARPRGTLTPDQRRRLERSAEKREKVEAAYRAEVLAVMAEGGSFSEVARSTGLSTNTLQRWKREAETPRDARESAEKAEAPAVAGASRPTPEGGGGMCLG